MSNEEFAEAWANPDYQRCGWKIAQKFRHQLTLEELRSAMLNAMWESLSLFDPKYRRTFTSYFVSHVKHHCLRQLFQNRPTASLPGVTVLRKVLDHRRKSPDIWASIESTLSKLKPAERFIILQKFLEGRTHKEIAQLMGTTTQNISQRLTRVLAKLHGLKDY